MVTMMGEEELNSSSPRKGEHAMPLSYKALGHSRNLFALTLKFLFKIFIFQSFTFQSIFKMLKGYTPGSLKSLLTSRVFTAKSRAALVSDGPYCKKKKINILLYLAMDTIN